MTSKLRRKLQTTIQRITVEPLKLCGKQEVCRTAVLLTATLVTSFAGADTYFVRPAEYQQKQSQMGNVPIVRIDSVQEENVKDSYVTPITYVSSVSEGTQPTQVSQTSGKALKWVAVNSPEARRMHDRTVRPVATKQVHSESLITPIPAVMPRYSRVKLTSGEELSLESLDFEEVEETKPLNGPLAMPAVDDSTDETSIMDSPTVDSSTFEIPEVQDFNVTPMRPKTSTDTQFPGAIGNETENSTLESGDSKQGAGVSIDVKNEELPVLNQLPQVIEPNDTLPGGNELIPLETPSLSQDTLSDSLVRRQVNEEDYDMPCESSEPMHRITEITNDIELHDSKIVPKSCPLSPEGEMFPVREFAGTNFTWTASNLCHNPLYFEQPALERYGHTIGPLQPVLSGAQFLATIPAMPMLMAIDPVNECQYSLGYHRPGSCAPHKWSPIPYSTRGAIVEGGVATALVFLIP